MSSTLPSSLFSSSPRTKLWLPQCHGSKAKTIKVYKYVNTVTAAQREERRNDIFCPRLANPQDTSKLETLMTTNNAQMVKLWGHAGPSHAARAPRGIALHANTLHTHTYRQEGLQINTCKQASQHHAGKQAHEHAWRRAHTDTHST